jgi:hypothetical protein
MNLSEFKAWFEGFTDGIDSNPTEKQWEKIKAKVAEIKAEPTSPLVIREYINNYRRYWNEPYWYGHLQPYATAGMGAAAINNMAIEKLSAGKPEEGDGWINGDGGTVFAPLSEATFRAMGAADAASLQ